MKQLDVKPKKKVTPVAPIPMKDENVATSVHFLIFFMKAIVIA